jgi:hypothetical protein
VIVDEVLEKFSRSPPSSSPPPSCNRVKARAGSFVRTIIGAAWRLLADNVRPDH